MIGLLAGVTASVSALTGSAFAAAPNGVPFAASSPFNQRVPANPTVAANTSSLDSGVGISMATYTPAVFVSEPTDPVVTIRLTSGWGPNPLDGYQVRVDPRARPAAESDAHLTIIVPDKDLVISLYQARPISGGTLSATWGGMAPLSGSGANRTDSPGGREAGISQLAGLITPDDVSRAIAAGEDGDLGHALSMLHDQISNRSFVAPAIQAGGLSGSSNALLMGQRVYLDPSINVASLPCAGDFKQQRFCRIVARTLQRYGAIVVTNTSSGSGFQMTNPLSWTALGLPNPWPALVGNDASGSYNFVARAIPQRGLRALAGQGVPGPTPPALTSPTRGTPLTPVVPGAPAPAASPTPPSAPPHTATPITPAGTTQPTAGVGPVVAEGAGVEVRRRIQVVRGTIHVRITLTSTRDVTVRARLRALRPAGAGIRRRRVEVVQVTPGTPVVVKMRLSADAAPTADFGLWVVRPGRDLELMNHPVKVA